MVQHLEKCRRTQRPSGADHQQLISCLEFAQQQQAICNINAAARTEKRAQQRRADAQRSKVPYFAALASCAPAAAERPCVTSICPTCSAEFRARDAANLARVVEEHTKGCTARCERRERHHAQVCEVTKKNAQHAQRRVEQLQKSVDKAKNALKAKQEAVEEQKRRNRLQQGRKNKNLKKHAYSLPADEPEDDDQHECTIQGCMQRLRAAETDLKAGQRRLKFREETAEICKAAAEGEEHRSVQQRAAVNKANKELKKQADYRKQHKKMSKENRAIEKTAKSKKKGERRQGADSKVLRASFE